MTEPSAAPLVALEASGQATILSYNVPEPTSYPGRNYIELPFDDRYFTAAGKVVPDRAKLAGRPLTEITSVVAASLDGAADPREFPLVAHAARGLAGFASRPARTRGGTAARQWNPDTGESTDLPGPDDEDSGHHGGQHGGGQGGDQDDDPAGPGTIASHIQAGLTPVVYTSLWGSDVSTWIPTAQTAEPRLYLVEEYRLSTYLGSYGAGRVVQTMTLLPGEKTTISVKSYTQSTTTQSEASSILDSFSEQSATDFESAVESEQSDQSTYAKSFEYKAEASASWGFGMVKVGGGVAGSTNSSREEAAKNVASATEKTSASASSKRDVQINTSSEVSTEVGSETSITREISNINLSAPLNFVFRQMNQEFITILHLVDVRVAFFNNFAESKQERPLPELGALLDEVMVDDADKRQEVRAEILHALNTVADWRGQPVRDAIRQRSYPERDGSVTKVWQFNRDLVTEYEDPATGAAFTVPGVILSVQKNVMRTEGIVVEALMGVAPALDPYNTALQEEALKERRAANTAAELSNRREELAQRIVSSGATNLADTYVRLFVPDPAPATDTPAPPAT
ncbi:hypothetical protein HDA40_001735 [Hamadaea flava]|uniref:Uncharacterized protein n=1 Tax=Hamadaea flava TaxID=1742688 RepID=A0ABV8LP27_9ACTN|nr:hypothetical protein [Hamadaea flava]MCP2323228.1 hypothetical protein [Hamadaea flava]